MQEEKACGRALAKAHVHVRKLACHTVPRILLAGVVVLAGVRGNPPGGKPASILALLIAAVIALAAAVWVLFPLVHCRDYVIFYEHAVEICGKIWTLDELGSISFMESKANYSFLARTYLCTDVRNFNITYIKDVKKNFNRAYLEQAP